MNKEKPSESGGRIFQGYEETSYSSTQIINTLFVRSFRFQTCPQCGKKLTKTKIRIPKDRVTAILYPAVTCGKHYYVWPLRRLRELVNANQYSKKIHFDCRFYVSKIMEVKEALSSCRVAPFCLLLLPTGHGKSQLVAITDFEKEVSDDCHILNYLSVEARRILANFYHRELGGYVEFMNQRYRPMEIPLDERRAIRICNELLISEISIKPGGGYRSHLKNRMYEIVDVLFYSPRTKNYEIVHATYDKRSLEYYIDISIYRNFVHEYGNPEIDLLPESHSSTGWSSDSLRDESLLHSYGYNVNQSEGLSDIERQAIIAEVIDLNLMNQKQIVQLLTMHSRRKNVYPQTTEKWKRDIDFTMNYKANPERFLIFTN